MAHAVPRWEEAWGRYATDLGGRWSSGGTNVGFAPGQLRFANGARIELLAPFEPERNDFLARFLDRSGPGAHHLTFKVPDLDVALAAARHAGFTPVNEDWSDPIWFEAFLHPREATGIVVQLAQTPIEWVSDPPGNFPSALRARTDGTGPTGPADLLRVCHVVDDLDRAQALFGGLLDGAVVAEGGAGDVRWIDLAWPGPLGLRLVAAADGATGEVAAWLDGRPGRVRHLELVVEEPLGVTGTGQPASDLCFLGEDGPVVEIPPADNLGLGLALRAMD